MKYTIEITEEDYVKLNEGDYSEVESVVDSILTQMREHMNNWPLYVRILSKSEILSCVRDSDWQDLRISLKGLPTSEKLDRLWEYYHEMMMEERYVRVTNYVNALLRGGQLIHSEGGIRVNK